jgi:hypothetical protein
MIHRKPSKMKNRKTGKYDSKREAKRATELQFMQRDGQISELREQVKFELIPSQRIGGKVVERAVTYTADFVYRDKTGQVIVEDSKGFKTQQYIIRRKLMLHVHGIRIQEV